MLSFRSTARNQGDGHGQRRNPQRNRTHATANQPQNKDILSIRRAGMDTAAALVMLSRMHDKVDALVAERHRLTGDERRRYASGKVINGTPAS